MFSMMPGNSSFFSLCGPRIIPRAATSLPPDRPILHLNKKVSFTFGLLLLVEKFVLRTVCAERILDRVL